MPSLPSDHRPTVLVRCARAAVLTLLVACTDAIGPGSHLPTTVRVRVTVPAATPAAWTPIGETLHVAVRRAGRVEPIVDTVFRVDSLAATLTIPLTYAVERFVATAEVRYSGVVLFLGFDALQLAAGGDTAVTLATSYVGPGARAATFSLGARDSTLAPGDTASLLPLVRDSAALVIPNVLARYVAARPSVVAVNGAVLTAQPGASDTARVTGFLPTGQSSALVVQAISVVIANVVVTPPSDTITSVAGIAQFTATAFDATGAPVPNQTFTWTSSDPGVATVDQNGLAAGVAAGTTTITATVAGVSGSAQLTVVLNSSATLRTWIGGAASNPTDWSTPANWDPAGVPGAEDTAVVVNTSGGVGPGNDPVLSAAVTVARLQILGGNLTLNGHALTVAGDLSTEEGVGTLTMQHPADTLRVLGNALFQGGITRDLLTDGVLFVRGHFRQLNFVENRGAFQATANHRTVLNGSATQLFSPAGDVTFGHLEFANTGGLIDGELEEVVEIVGTLRFSTAVAFEGGDITLDIEDSLVMTVDSRLTTHRVRLSGGMQVAGLFEVNQTEFAGNNQEIQPGLNYQIVRVTEDARLTGPTEIALALEISDDGRMTLNGNSLTVPLLRIVDEGTLVMQHPNDQLIVAGDASFDGDTLPDLMTNGVLRVSGSFTVGSGSGRRVLRASGNHRTVLNGSGVQLLTIDARATFGHLEIATAAGGRIEVPATDEVVDFTVLGKLRMSTPVSLGGEPDLYQYVRIDLGDSLVTVAGSALDLGEIILRGGIALNGILDADHIEFAGTNQPIPSSVNYEHVTISGTAQLTGATTFGGFALVRGPQANLALNAHKLTIGGPFTVGGIGEPYGTVTMSSDADSLVVGADAVFAGAASDGRLTAGTVIVGGGFFSAEDPASFRPSGTHRVIMNGGSQQRVHFDQPGIATSRFNHLVLANSAGGLWLESPVYVAGELVTAGPAQLVAGNSHYLLIANSVDVRQLTLDTIPLAIGGGTIARFDTVTFQRQNRGAVQLGVTHAGQATPFRFNGVRFLTPPTTGDYVAATDAAPSDGAVLTIELDGSFPADGSSETSTSGGAVVTWLGGTPPLMFNQVAAGVSFSCALTTTNAPYCWGTNGSGQLGTGTTASVSVPAAVQGGLTFTRITAGGQHACGVTAAGAVYCWGSNAYGQLGDNTTTDRLTPTPIASGLTFTTVTAGDQYTCAIDTSQLAYCWGRNSFGQLGDLTTTDRSSPTAVDGNVQFSALAAGTNHVCGLSNDAAYCWGSNTNGQLGDGTTTNSSTPVLVGGASGGFSFRRIAAGSEHTCAISSTVPLGAAYCWGWNNVGQLGDGTTTSRLLPTQISGSVAFSSITAGGNGFTCGVSTSGDGYCWGINNVGQLGDGTQTQRLTATPMTGGLLFTAISAGFAHVLATSTAAYAWGGNSQGQLGDGTTTMRTAPVLILTPATP